jgi:hypothetical protein
MSTYFHVTSSPGYYFAVIAAGNLAGPLLLAIAFFYALGTRYRGIPLGHSSVRPERRSAVLPVNGGLRA